MSERWITVSLPESSWRQLVSDYKEMCGGISMEEIEILQDVEIDGYEDR